jgi:hypothetical protein
VLGFDHAVGGDEVFAQLVLARIIEPTSKLDSARVLEEAGVSAPSYRMLLRRLPIYAKDSWRQKLAAACAAHTRLGRASLVLYEVSTLYFETDAGMGSSPGRGSPSNPNRRRPEPVNVRVRRRDQAGGFLRSCCALPEFAEQPVINWACCPWPWAAAVILPSASGKGEDASDQS